MWWAIDFLTASLRALASGDTSLAAPPFVLVDSSATLGKRPPLSATHGENHNPRQALRSIPSSTFFRGECRVVCTEFFTTKEGLLAKLNMSETVCVLCESRRKRSSAGSARKRNVTSFLRSSVRLRLNCVRPCGRNERNPHPPLAPVQFLITDRI